MIYIYSCPDGTEGTVSAPIKLRMLFSSSKATVAALMTSIGKDIDAKLEVSAGSEVVKEDIHTTLHPVKVERKRIVKPRPPGGRRRR